MAQIENFSGGEKNINLTASVGKNGVNLKDDVMVVQAMLQYALKGKKHFKEMRFPEPLGIMNNETKNLIKEYQRFLKRKLGVSVSLDGVIDRAIGDKAFGRNGAWTILWLNGHVMERRLLKGGIGNHFQDLCLMFPQLNEVLEIPVGELELTLESSPLKVGSLGLTLE
jgi:hypothetical protein